MGRIRTVKPELFTHEGLFEAEERYKLPLRLVFIGLFTCCDQAGRFRWQPRRLKLDILPYDSVDMSLVLDALVETGFIGAYQVESVLYGYIPTWSKHQRPNNKESKSQIPDVEQGAIVKPPVEMSVIRDLNASITVASRVVVANATAALFDPVAATITSKCINSNKKIEITDNKENFSSRDAQACSFENKTINKEMVSDYKNGAFLHDSHAITSRQSSDDHATFSNLGWREGKGKEREYGREWGREQEPEGEGCGEGKPKRAEPSSESTKTIFACWQQVMNHPKAVLDKSRQKSIRNALAMGYDISALCQAIRGCACTPHNIGQNDRGERYDGLHVIFKSADQIDRFIRNAQNPPRPLGKSEQRLQNNITAAEQWLNQSQTTEGEVNHGNRR